MGELTIKEHDFKNAIRRIKEFSQSSEEEMSLPTVETDGGFLWLGDHKVTGEEFNDRLAIIQELFIEVNDGLIRTGREFGEVYNALQALDKDYIQAILISMKAIEKTSERIEKTQGDIKNIVKDQKRTLEMLKKFKIKLDNYVHLGDIDKLWEDYQDWKNEVSILPDMVENALETGETNSKEITKISENMRLETLRNDSIEKWLTEQTHKLKPVFLLFDDLNKCDHLNDVDDIWHKMKEVQQSIQKIQLKLPEIDDLENTLSEEISKLEPVYNLINEVKILNHLLDIDDMWNKVGKVEQSVQDITEKSTILDAILKKHEEEILRQEAHIASLDKLKHLYEIDNLWNDNKIFSEQISKLIKENDRTNKQIDEVKKNTNSDIELIQNEIESNLKKIEELFEQNGMRKNEIEQIGNQNSELSNIVCRNKKSIDATIERTEASNNKLVETLTKKIKGAYFVASCGMGFAVIELIIMLLR